MYATRSGYDRGVNTFSPEGRLFQVEYAIKAIELGSCAVGVRTSEGVVLAVEKRLTSPLLEPTSVEKIFEVDTNIGCAISGLTADARTLVDYGRVECQNHRFTYDEPLRVESLTQSLCDLAMSFAEEREEEEEEEGGGGGEPGGQKKPRMSRPFGVSLLIAGCDARGPQLIHMDPSGTFIVYDAHAIGAGAEGAITQLVEKYNKNMTLEQAKALVTRVMADTMEEKLTPTNFELATVTTLGGFKLETAATLLPLIAVAVEASAAEAAL